METERNRSRSILEWNLRRVQIVTDICKYDVHRVKAPNKGSRKDYKGKTLNSIYGFEYGIMPGTGKKGYYREKEDFSYKTLCRDVDSLVKDGYLIMDENKELSLNLQLILNFNKQDKAYQEKIKRMLLENGDRKSYEALRNNDCGDYYNDIELNRYEKCVKLYHMDLAKDKNNIIKIINSAILRQKKIDILQLTKRNPQHMTILPVCYAIDRRGIKCYLWFIRKNKPYSLDIDHISILTNTDESEEDKEPEKLEINYEEMLEKIRKSWDANDGEEADVKVLILKNQGDNAREELLNRGWEEVQTDDYYILKDHIYGLNGFKTWLRSHSDCCFLLEPKSVRDSIMKSLDLKLKAYEEISE